MDPQYINQKFSENSAENNKINEPINEKKKLRHSFFEIFKKLSYSKKIGKNENPRCFNWKPLSCDPEIALKRMRNNSIKAINEHQKAQNIQISPTVENNNSLSVEIIDKEEVVKESDLYWGVETVPSLEKLSLFNANPQKPVKAFLHSFEIDKGKRDHMEDYYFYKRFREGNVFAGVLDGHSGDIAANFSAENAHKFFDSFMKKNKQNVFEALEKTVKVLNEEALKLPGNSGCTAVFVYIDEEHHLVYTATVGDSQALLVRTIQNQTKAIPLSCLRNWCSPHDEKRALRYFHEERKNNNYQKEREIIKRLFEKQTNPKLRRFGTKHNCINVSRAIGDKVLKSLPHTALIEKPKITVNILEEGDLIILGSDGFFDYSSIKEQLKTITQFETTQLNGCMIPLAEQLLMLSKENMTDHGDNITVLVIGISKY